MCHTFSHKQPPTTTQSEKSYINNIDDVVDNSANNEEKSNLNTKNYLIRSEIDLNILYKNLPEKARCNDISDCYKDTWRVSNPKDRKSLSPYSRNDKKVNTKINVKDNTNNNQIATSVNTNKNDVSPRRKIINCISDSNLISKNLSSPNTTTANSSEYVDGHVDISNL